MDKELPFHHNMGKYQNEHTVIYIDASQSYAGLH